MRQPKQAKGTGESQMRAGAQGTSDVNEAVKPPGSQYPKVHDGGDPSSDETPDLPGDARAREARWPWCTPSTLSALCVLLEAGIDLVTACKRLHIPRNSLYTAKREDADIGEMIDDARARWEESAIGGIMRAAEDIPGEGRVQRGDWKALAWLLTKRMPKKYGDRSKVDLAGSLALKAGGDVVERVKAAITAAEQDNGEE